MNAGPTIHRYQLLAGSLLVIAPLLAFAGPPAGSVPNSDGRLQERATVTGGTVIHETS